MKATPYEWRKATVAGFDAQLKVLTAQRDQLQQQIDDLIQLRDSLMKADLKRPYNKKEETTAPVKVAAKSAHRHWTKRPGVDPKKVAAWKARMRAINLERNRK